MSITHLLVYTAGVSHSKQKDYPGLPTAQVWNVGKSLLINNYLNYSSSSKYHIIKEFNKKLIDEINQIEMSETIHGNIAMKTPDNATDDILNATMTAMLIINKENLDAHLNPNQNYQHSLHNHDNQITPNKNFIEEIKASYPLSYRRKRQSN